MARSKRFRRASQSTLRKIERKIAGQQRPTKRALRRELREAAARDELPIL